MLQCRHGILQGRNGILQQAWHIAGQAWHIVHIAGQAWHIAGQAWHIVAYCRQAWHIAVQAWHIAAYCRADMGHGILQGRAWHIAGHAWQSRHGMLLGRWHVAGCDPCRVCDDRDAVLLAFPGHWLLRQALGMTGVPTSGFLADPLVAAHLFLMTCDIIFNSTI